MMLSKVSGLCTAIALACMFTFHAGADTPVLGRAVVESVFQGGSDGWKGMNDAALRTELAKLRGEVTPIKRGRSAPRDVRTARDPASPTGGYISLAALGGDGHTLYFTSPNKYSGNRSAAYGGNIAIQIRQTATGRSFTAPFVILSSKSTTLFYFLGRTPRSSWERIEVPLKEGSGWMNAAKGERVPATKEDLESVLAALSDLWIQAEFSVGEDRSELASVQLNKPLP